MKVAGIDVPKKVLMAVVVDCEYAGRETSATAIRHHGAALDKAGWINHHRRF